MSSQYHSRRNYYVVIRTFEYALRLSYKEREGQRVPEAAGKTLAGAPRRWTGHAGARPSFSLRRQNGYGLFCGKIFLEECRSSWHCTSPAGSNVGVGTDGRFSRKDGIWAG